MIVVHPSQLARGSHDLGGFQRGKLSGRLFPTTKETRDDTSL
jgi:hypothetical protein